MNVHPDDSDLSAVVARYEKRRAQEQADEIGRMEDALLPYLLLLLAGLALMLAFMVGEIIYWLAQTPYVAGGFQ